MDRGAKDEAAWNANMAAYKGKYPKEAAELEGLLSGKLPQVRTCMPVFVVDRWPCHHHSSRLLHTEGGGGLLTQPKHLLGPS